MLVLLSSCLLIMPSHGAGVASGQFLTSSVRRAICSCVWRGKAPASAKLRTLLRSRIADVGDKRRLNNILKLGLLAHFHFLADPCLLSIC